MVFCRGAVGGRPLPSMALVRQSSSGCGLGFQVKFLEMFQVVGQAWYSAGVPSEVASTHCRVSYTCHRLIYTCHMRAWCSPGVPSEVAPSHRQSNCLSVGVHKTVLTVLWHTLYSQVQSARAVGARVVFCWGAVGGRPRPLPGKYGTYKTVTFRQSRQSSSNIAHARQSSLYSTYKTVKFKRKPPSRRAGCSQAMRGRGRGARGILLGCRRRSPPPILFHKWIY